MEDSVMNDPKNTSQSSATQENTTQENTAQENTARENTAQSNVTETVLLDNKRPDSNRYVMNSKVVITDLGDELVLMEPTSGKMFSLNSSGRILWQRLPATASELAAALCEAFEVSREDALEDSQAWLSALISSGLVHK